MNNAGSSVTGSKGPVCPRSIPDGRRDQVDSIAGKSHLCSAANESREQLMYQSINPEKNKPRQACSVHRSRGANAGAGAGAGAGAASHKLAAAPKYGILNLGAAKETAKPQAM